MRQRLDFSILKQRAPKLQQCGSRWSQRAPVSQATIWSTRLKR